MNNLRVSHRPPSPNGSRDYHAYHDPESTARLSTTVVHALADLLGANVTDVGLDLSDSVDPDALDRIFSGTPDVADRTPGHLAFTVHDYRVTVYETGQIVITPPPFRPAV